MPASLQSRVVHLDNARYHGGPRDLARVDMCLWHTTEGHTFKEAMGWDNRPNSDNPASYHFGIERDGTIYRTVPVELESWGAGNSGFPNPGVWPPGTPKAQWLNHRAINIAFAGDIGDPAHPELAYATRAQIESGYWLARLVVAGQLHAGLAPIGSYMHRAHREVSPGRKFDPRPTFLIMAWWRWAVGQEMNYGDLWDRYVQRHAPVISGTGSPARELDSGK